MQTVDVEPVTEATLSPVDRYRRAFTAYARRELSAKAVQWEFVFGWTAALAVSLLVVTRTAQTLAFATDAGAVEWLVVGAILLLAAGAIFLLARLYWMTRVGQGGGEPYALAVVCSAAALIVCTEAFAGLTLLLWKQRVVSSVASARPDLWSSELDYLWHLADAIPLLSVPSTLGLSPPHVFTDHVSGCLLLSFRLLVIAPLLHISISGYQLATQRWLSRAEQARKRRERQARTPDAAVSPLASFDDDGVWSKFVVLVIATALALAVVVIVSDPTSALNHWLVDHTRVSLRLADRNVSLHWLRAVPQWGAAVVLICGLPLGVMLLAMTINRWAEASLAYAAGLILACAALLALVTVGCAAISVALVRVGLASFHPSVAPGGEVSAALGAFAWHLSDAVPGLKLTQTLNWNLHSDLSGISIGIVLLVYKATFIGVVVVPLGLTAAAYVARKRPTKAVRAIVASAREFADGLVRVDDKLDKLEEESLRVQEAPPTKGARSARLRADAFPAMRQSASPGLGLGRSRSPELGLGRSPYSRALRGWATSKVGIKSDLQDLRATIDQVETLFGDLDATPAARRALDAVADRYEVLQSYELRENLNVEQIQTASADAKDAIRAFQAAADDAIGKATAPRPEPSTEPQRPRSASGDR